MNIISQLNTAKPYQNADFAKFISNNFNHCIDECDFPYELKHVGVIPVHKKKDKCVKDNYRPVSILTNISKVCEKLLYNQLYSSFDNILSPNQFGFWKGHSAQECLLVMIEKLKQAIDKDTNFVPFWQTCPKHLIVLTTPQTFNCKALLVWNFTFIN